MNESAREFAIGLLMILMAFPIAGAAESIQLTQEELEFISAHPEIRLGVDPEFVPFEFIDGDGTYQGISADVVALIAKSTGLRFTASPGLTWVEVGEKAKNRELDVLPAVGETDERMQYMLFTRPYITFQRAVVVKNTNQSINSFEDLYGRQVAAQENSSHYDFLLKYPMIGIRPYPTVEDALLAVNRGEEIAFIGNEATTSVIARSNGMTELSFIPINTGEVLQLHFAIRNDWPQLHSIIDKALHNISEQEFSEIYNRWIRYETRIDYSGIIRVAILIGSILLIVFGVSAFWIIRLRKEIRRKEIAQREMEAARQKAEQADREKSRFMARMSHEIRTPLNGINGMAYLLERTDLDKIQRRFLETIGQAAHTMLAIINDILDFSRIEERQITLEHVRFNLDTILQQVVSIDAWTVKEKGLAISVERRPDVPVHLLGDPTRLTQILTNIIHNAVKFTSEGGIEARISCPVRNENSCALEFLVRDTGLGMSEEQMTDMFKPFNQADESIARRFGGSGLGLSIVKSLVELMRGTIAVESELGKGSSFTVSIPFALDVEGLAENEKLLSMVDFKSLRVLLVIRKEEVFKSVESILSSYGIKFDLISSEQLALSLFIDAGGDKGNHYDLVVMDARSWEVRPLALLAGLAETEKTSSRPKTMLIIGDDTDSSGVVLLKGTGVDLMLPEPVIPSIFFNALLELFPPVPFPMDAPRKVPPIQSPIPQYHILVVEDNPTNRLLASEVLVRSGLRVAIAANGKEGVELFLKFRHEIDAVLMDLHMDIMNGYEAAARIREIDTQIPIIATTADIIDSVQMKCREAGFNAVILKPYDPGILVKKILEVVTTSHELGSGSGAINFSDGLKRMGGDHALYGRVIDSFLQEHESLVILLRKQVMDGQFGEASETAHKIKGGCGAISAYPAQRLAALLQETLGKEPHSDISTTMRLFEQEFARVVEEAKRWSVSSSPR